MNLKGKMNLTRSVLENVTSSRKNTLIFGSEMPRGVRTIHKMYYFFSRRRENSQNTANFGMGCSTPLSMREVGIDYFVFMLPFIQNGTSLIFLSIF